MEKIGKYQVIDLLGKGAMGIVYKALDPDIDREVAIKTIRFDLISDDAEKDELMLRFVREARAAGRLVHPNIITIHDVGKEGDMTYIVMQYIEGLSLQKWMSSKNNISAPEIVDLMLQLCDALDFAHQRGIVHRDIKPANILLDDTGKPHICDFGVAHVEMSTITQTGVAMGTPSYMSPEQVMGKKIDKRSDVFSLGAILFELLTGKRPFGGDSITTVIYKIVNEDAPSLAGHGKEVSMEFEAIVRRALAKDPEKRYSSCSEMAADIKKIAYFADETQAMTGVQKPELGGDIAPKKRKRRMLFPAFAGIVIVLGIGGYFLYQKLGDTSSLREESQPILTESALSEPRAMDSVIDALETVSAKLMKNYDSGNYAEVIRIAQGVLAQDTQNTEALEYLSKARTRINANRIAEYVSIGKRDYENGDYERCKDNMVLALNIDSQNAEAQRFYALADKALSEVAIGEIVERQRRAEEQKDLLTFLSDIGPEELQEKKRTDVVALFNSYDDINSRISDLSIEFIDLDHADVAFSHLLVGVDKASGKKKVIFEGRKTLTLERSGEAWKILVYR